MKFFQRSIALAVIASILYSLISGIFTVSFAAALPVNVYVNSYANGGVTLRWDAVPYAKSVVVTYHMPGQALMQKLVSKQTTNTMSVSGLKDDYIYDFHVYIYDVDDPTDTNNPLYVDDKLNTANNESIANTIGYGFLYFLPKISFYVTRLDQTREALVGGAGWQIGTRPRLNLKWTMPKVYSSSTNNFEYAYIPAVQAKMQETIQSIYQDGRQIASMNFRFNISTDLATLNSGSAQSSVLVNEVNQGAAVYKANVASNDTVTSDVRGFGPDDADVDNDGDKTEIIMNNNGLIDFDLLGRKDLNTLVTAPDNTYTLQDQDMLPGTVYYMNIKPVFKNSSGTNVNAITVGPPAAQNGSPISGLLPYAYTPLRFELTKDAADNVYVKIFKINQGSLDLPRLYYEVQAIDDPSIPNDWPVKKTIDDSFFSHGSEWAITVITGTNPYNEIFYKIVVKSDSANDRMESSKMPYIIAADNSRPPVPKGVGIIKRVLVTRTVGSEIEKTTNVTISWEKPADWDKIKANKNAKDDVVFHVLLNVDQSDLNIQPYPALESEGKLYGHFPVKYRLVKYFSARSPDIVENGNHLEYTIKGFELFNSDYMHDFSAPADDPNPNDPKWDDDLVNGAPKIDTVDINPHEKDADNNEYPSALLPNKTYYMQLYTTKGVNKGSTNPEDMSDKSVITSFTTLTGVERDAPLPKNFGVSANNVRKETDPDTGEEVVKNYIDLTFDAVSVDWNNYTPNHDELNDHIYYDLYMNTRTDADTFTLVGSTDGTSDGVTFTPTGPQNTTIKATVEDFDSGSDSYTRFGASLRPNTTYYFIVKTRMVITTPSGTRESIPTSILPVTTIIGSVTPPDDSTRVPLAPSDFAIAKYPNGNLMLTGSSVTLSWTRKETDVKYEIICTSKRIAPVTSASEYEGDPIYQSFTDIFSDEMPLDPAAPFDLEAHKFEYNAAKMMCSYGIKQWLFPNRLYFFSIRAINNTNGNVSSWICIPVTTYLIDAPTLLEPVKDIELGFRWTDGDINLRAEDFKIYLKGPKDADYKPLTRTQSTVTRSDSLSEGEPIYYGRAKNLLPNTEYGVRVYKGGADPVLVYETQLTTRDSYHEIEVRWMGQPSYGYELVAKKAEDTDYTTVQLSDLEEYEDENGDILSYSVEHVPQTVGTPYRYFYARIKSLEVTLPDGTVEQRPLKSNTKYYIKVRAVKEDDMDTSLKAYSKFIGPVNTRTEFNQDDYNKEDEDNKKTAMYMDKIGKFEEKLFWKVDMSNEEENKLLLRGDKMADAIRNSGKYGFTLDISGLLASISTDALYIPSTVVKLLGTENKNLIIKTQGSEFTLRPKTLEADKMEKVTGLMTSSEAKDLFFKLTVTRSDSPEEDLPEGVQAVSKVNDLEVEAVGSSKTDKELEKQIHDRLYDKETGLVNEKLNEMLSTDRSEVDTSKGLEAYINAIVGEVESDLSDFINDAIEGGSEDSGMILGTSGIENFVSPLMVKLACTGSQGLKRPYVRYNGTGSWQAITLNTAYAGNMLTFNAEGTGWFVAGMIPAGTEEITDDYWAKGDIASLMSKYDLRDVFGKGSSFYPESSVSVGELILLYEKITGKSAQNNGMDIKQKARKLGLDTLLDISNTVRDVQRQETAGALVKFYSARLGVNADSLKPRKNIFFKDEADIGGKYYKSAVIAVDIGILAPGSSGAFGPAAPVTRAEMVTAFVKLLKLTGDM